MVLTSKSKLTAIVLRSKKGTGREASCRSRTAARRSRSLAQADTVMPAISAAS